MTNVTNINREEKIYDGAACIGVLKRRGDQFEAFLPNGSRVGIGKTRQQAEIMLKVNAMIPKSMRTY